MINAINELTLDVVGFFSFSANREQEVFKTEVLSQSEILVRDYLGKILKNMVKAKSELHGLTSYDLVQLLHSSGGGNESFFAKPIQYTLKCSQSQIEEYNLVRTFH